MVLVVELVLSFHHLCLLLLMMFDFDCYYDDELMLMCNCFVKIEVVLEDMKLALKQVCLLLKLKLPVKSLF